MNNTIIVHGMKRSGNHAIINWLKAHDSFLFFNNIIPVTPILRGEEPMPAPQDFDLWLQRRMAPSNIRRHIHKGNRLYAAYLRHVALRGRSLMVSLEDHEMQLRPFIEVPEGTINLLIIRDPYNLFASRIRRAFLIDKPAYPREAGPQIARIVALWKQHAREYLGHSDHLANKVRVSFNSWFSDRAYRQQISARLGLAFTDDGFSEVSREGGGSSFDSTRFNGDNRKMGVLDRQSHLNEQEQALFAQVVADTELQELAEQLAAQSVGGRAAAENRSD